MVRKMCDMTPEEALKQKEYNKKYQELNKTKIKEELTKKEPCLLCSRCITHQQMSTHQKTKYCLSRRKINEDLKPSANNNSPNISIQIDSKYLPIMPANTQLILNIDPINNKVNFMELAQVGAVSH